MVSCVRASLINNKHLGMYLERWLLDIQFSVQAKSKQRWVLTNGNCLELG